jgi:molybdopterin molybdotransferase
MLFARPALWKLGGRSALELPQARARLGQDIVNRGDRPHYLRGVYHNGAFKPVGRQESHALYALSQANALCRLEPDQMLEAGSFVEVIPV